MRDLIIAEAVKLRRSGVPWFLLAAALIPAIANMFYPKDFSWDGFVLSALLFVNLAGLIVVVPLSGYSICREYESRTLSAVLGCPVPRWRLLLAKFLVFVPQSLAVVFLCLAATLAGGALLSGTLPPAEGLPRWAACAAVLSCLHLGLAPAAMLAGILARRTVAPVLVGLALLMLYRTFLFTGAGTFVPSSIPSLFLMHEFRINPYGIPFAFDGRWAALSVGGFFLAGSIGSAWIFRRGDAAG